VRQVVVQPEASSLRIHKRQTFAHDSVAAEGLLHAKDRFETAHEAVQAAEGLCTVIGFDPVTLRMMATGELGTQTKPRILRLPPDACAIEILPCVLKKTIVGETDFEAPFYVWANKRGPLPYGRRIASDLKGKLRDNKAMTIALQRHDNNVQRVWLDSGQLAASEQAATALVCPAKRR
jgi:hypothetical protein